MSKEERTIVIDSISAKNDGNRPTRLPVSELIYQRWQQIAGDDVRNLDNIIHPVINNPGFTTHIGDLIKKFKFDRKKATEFPRSTLGSEVDDAFRTLSGFDNSRPEFYLYKDHHQELGDLKVVKINAWGTFSVESFPALAFRMGRAA
jgi:hypothetical protein